MWCCIKRKQQHAGTLSHQPPFQSRHYSSKREYKVLLKKEKERGSTKEALFRCELCSYRVSIMWYTYKFIALRRQEFLLFGHSNHQRKYDPNYQRQMDPKGDDSTIRSYETGSNKEICLATQVRLSQWYRAGPDGRQHLNKFSLALPGGVHPTQFYSLAV